MVPKSVLKALEGKIEASESSGGGGADLRIQKPTVNSSERALEAVLTAEKRVQASPGPRSLFKA